jgi:hypothetical protein
MPIVSSPPSYAMWNLHEGDVPLRNLPVDCRELEFHLTLES